jgi:hypothetical protein
MSIVKTVKTTGLSFIYVAGLLLAAQAQAAVISWTGAALDGTGATKISNSGDLVKAINFAGLEKTVNLGLGLGDVTFEAGAGQNPFSLTYPSYNPANTTGNVSFDSILNTGSWQVAPGTITYSGLTSGVNYLVQIFSLDSRGGDFGKRSVAVDEALASASFSDPLQDGWVFNGTFTADATSQDVIMTGSVFAGDGKNYVVANASQLRKVPEPATLSLLGLGLLGLSFMRRKRAA